MVSIIGFYTSAIGHRDFNENQISVTFPVTKAEVDTIDISIPFVDDSTVEEEEGFYLLITANASLSHSTDLANAAVINKGMALVRIIDDGKTVLAVVQLWYTSYCTSVY